MTCGLLLYLKLARVVVGNVSKKGKNMEGIIVWSIFASWFFNQLCLYIAKTVPFGFKLLLNLTSLFKSNRFDVC